MHTSSTTLNNWAKISFVFMISIFFYACEAEDTKPPDPCEGISCTNGVCFDGSCRCNKGYTGSDCLTEVAPKAVLITDIKILKFPETNNGNAWDNTSTGRPDLWIRIFRGATLVHEQDGSTAISNALLSADNVYSPASRIRLSEVDSDHEIALYDYDGNPSSNAPDYMGSVNFDPYSASRSGFPTSFIIDLNGNVSFELTVYYEF